MADETISDQTELTSADPTDEILIQDVSANETKKITAQNLGIGSSFQKSGRINTTVVGAGNSIDFGFDWSRGIFIPMYEATDSPNIPAPIGFVLESTNTIWLGESAKNIFLPMWLENLDTIDYTMFYDTLGNEIVQGTPTTQGLDLALVGLPGDQPVIIDYVVWAD